METLPSSKAELFSHSLFTTGGSFGSSSGRRRKPGLKRTSRLYREPLRHTKPLKKKKVDYELMFEFVWTVPCRIWNMCLSSEGLSSKRCVKINRKPFKFLQLHQPHLFSQQIVSLAVTS